MSFFTGLISIAVLVAVFAAAGGNPAQLADGWALLLVAGGTAALGAMSSPFSVLGRLLHHARHALHRADGEKVEKELFVLARLAREKGLLALEPAEGWLTDPLVREGVRLISAAAGPDAVRLILEKEAESERAGGREVQSLFERMGCLGIGVGAAGTLFRIILVLRHYTGPRAFASGMAGALIPLTYGVLLAYLVLFPLAGRIREGAEHRRKIRQTAIEGVLAIQAGESMFLVERRLETLLRPGEERTAPRPEESTGPGETENREKGGRV